MDLREFQARQAHLVKQDGMEATVCLVLQEKLVNLGPLESRDQQVLQDDVALLA